jgi:hypothetical protein
MYKFLNKLRKNLMQQLLLILVFIDHFLKLFNFLISYDFNHYAKYLTGRYGLLL